MLRNYLFLLYFLAPLETKAADHYPQRPVRIVVPTGAGGVTDVVARVIAQRLGEQIVELLNREIVRIVKTSAFVEQFAPEGIVPVGNKPEEFARMMVDDIATWGKVIRGAGIRIE